MPDHSNISSPSESSGKPPRRNSVGDSVQRRKYIRRPKPDMHAPKRPLSAYINFSKDQRNEYEHNNWAFSTLAKHIGEDWRDLDLNTKNRYLEEAANDKLQYDQSTRRYKNTAAYGNYKKYVQEFNRRHNSSQVPELSTSPEHSPSPSPHRDEAPDVEMSLRDDFNSGLPRLPMLSHPHVEQNGNGMPMATQPPGTVNPASLGGATPSPTDLAPLHGMRADHYHLSLSAPHALANAAPPTAAAPSLSSSSSAAPGFLSSMSYSAEHFGGQGWEAGPLRPADAQHMHAYHLDAPPQYSHGPGAMHVMGPMGFQTGSVVDDEVARQHAYSWTNAYLNGAR